VYSAAGRAPADSWDGLVRVVAARTGRFYGVPMTAGDIYQVAGGLAFPGGVAADAHGNLLIANTLTSQVQVVAATTGTFYGQAMTAGHLYTVASLTAAGISVDSSGNLLVTGNTQVEVVAERTGTFYGVPMTAGGTYPVAGTATSGFSGDGGPATSAELDTPQAAVAAGREPADIRFRQPASPAGAGLARAPTRMLSSTGTPPWNASGKAAAGSPPSRSVSGRLS
jgi:hypothetical protein